MNISVNIEKYYNKFNNNLTQYFPDGMIEVDLTLLQRLELLDYPLTQKTSSAFTHYFQVIESHKKLVLTNDQYVIWIINDQLGITPSTTTFIALRKNNKLLLQLGFTNKGIYNNSQLVLLIIEKLLIEIQETETVLSKIN